ncbi:hypothetical protein K1719_004093 [Acacia pycnantha]|nr:hypothetical protein K1719_004093 [Acacia pycnantha]
MDNALIDAFMLKLDLGNIVNGSFASTAYENITKYLSVLFGFQIDKEKVKLRAAVWRNTLLPNYEKMVALYENHRANRDDSDTSSNMKKRRRSSPSALHPSPPPFVKT